MGRRPGPGVWAGGRRGLKAVLSGWILQWGREELGDRKKQKLLWPKRQGTVSYCVLAVLPEAHAVGRLIRSLLDRRTVSGTSQGQGSEQGSSVGGTLSPSGTVQNSLPPIFSFKTGSPVAYAGLKLA